MVADIVQESRCFLTRLAMARKSVSQPQERFPPIFIEGLAYHEAGHVLVAVLFGAPISVPSACAMTSPRGSAPCYITR